MAAPAIDGFATASFSGSTGSLALTTAQASDVVVLFLFNSDPVEAASGLAITGGAARWVRRNQAYRDDFSGGVQGISEVWFGFAAAPLSAATINILFDRVTTAAAAIAFGVSGTAPGPELLVTGFWPAASDLPWDLSSFLQNTSGDLTGASTAPGTNIVTVGGADLLLGFRATVSVPGGVVAGPGYTTLTHVNNTGGGTNACIFVEYKTVTAPQQSPTLIGEGQSMANWRMISDALVGPTPSGPIPYALPSRSGDWAQKDLRVAVEIDLHAGGTGGPTTIDVALQLCNAGPLIRDFSGLKLQYEPRLVTPILLGTRISAELYGRPAAPQPNAGTIEIMLDRNWPWFQFQYHWLYRTFRVYEGISAEGDYADLALVYTGRISGIQYDNQKATLTTTDASADLDKPLVTALYDATFPVAIQGKPLPQLWGTGYSIEPRLINEANLIYQVSRRPLDSVIELRVGGVPWRQVAAPPAQGEYSVDLANGTVTLGSVTLGGDVRCDAKDAAWATCDTAALITAIALQGGAAVDNGSTASTMDQLSADFPALVGYYANEAINILDALDDIVAGNLCYWATNAAGEIIAGFLLGPEGSAADFALTDVQIVSAQLAQSLPPAWRVRTEYARNWSPSSNFFGAVTEADQARWRSTGLTTQPPTTSGGFDPDQIRLLDPKAEDILLKSVVVSQADAETLRDHLALSLTGEIARGIYDVTAWLPAADVALYRNVLLSYHLLQKQCRVHGALRSIGGGPAQFQLWG
jgi:hypothetical protein